MSDESKFKLLTRVQLKRNTNATHSRKRCYDALQILKQLIPGIERKASTAENIYNFCAPVRLPLFPSCSH
jgi:hypothetical protein